MVCCSYGNRVATYCGIIEVAQVQYSTDHKLRIRPAPAYKHVLNQPSPNPTINLKCGLLLREEMETHDFSVKLQYCRRISLPIQGLKAKQMGQLLQRPRRGYKRIRHSLATQRQDEWMERERDIGQV